MNLNQFWQKASDFYDIHHGKYRHAVLTDEELRETVTDYISDMTILMRECEVLSGKEKHLDS